MHYITITCNAKIGALHITYITWENVMHYRALQLQISITPLDSCQIYILISGGIGSHGMSQ